MSSSSYESTCPNCGGEMESFSENRPFDQVNHDCLQCGFYTYTERNYNSLEEVNEARAERKEDGELEGYEPLTELPEQKEF